MPSTAAPLAALAPATNGAEALVQHLTAQGVDWIFLNPGTDTAPLQEAVVALGAAGHAVPRVQVCPDERVAMAAAQAYWTRTGRPQAVIVHVDVGTQALGASLHNAQRTHSGVVVIAGRAPRTFDGSLPGGRSIAVHWQQDQADPAGIVRNYVKWAEEITLVEALPHLLPRAFQVARSGPAGPVYLTVAREVLMAPVDGVRVPSPDRHRAPVTPPACRDAIAEAATWLREAERPILLTARAGRSPGTVEALDALAITLGLPVADSREVLNLPSDHPCYVEDDAVGADLLREADLVLVVDHEVPWVPLNRQPPEQARVVQIDLDPTKQTMVNWSFAVDLPIQADSAKALWQLLEEVRAQTTPADEERWATRLAALVAAKEDRAVARDARLDALRTAAPVAAELVADLLGTLLPDDAVVLEEVTTNDMLVREHLARRTPGSIHAIGAAGLGWAMGAALGVKLAEPDREVVAFCGDGSFMFSAPLAALWTARDAGAPFLTVVLNNHGYRAAMFPVRLLFPEGASVNRDDFTGTVFRESVDFAAVARSCGAFGVTVTEPDQLAEAIDAARSAVRDGVCAVVDIHLERI
jgi:acetolactate synthase-1/2/3 large subunit